MWSEDKHRKVKTVEMIVVATFDSAILVSDCESVSESSSTEPSACVIQDVYMADPPAHGYILHESGKKVQ